MGHVMYRTRSRMVILNNATFYFHCLTVCVPCRVPLQTGVHLTQLQEFVSYTAADVTE